ncbi:class I SAM-dependent methyltransferase [Desulfosporosinus sp. SB140]|uniref:class I SAM-dependent methyltransferase n=1 Tax=Desulfosporosinus paludis TaxID=3115649 RepID=UPI00388D5B85
MEKNLIKVEIGCGKTKTDGYIGIDRFPLQGVDIVADVDKGLPFDNDSVDVIYASHSLEHMENLQNVMEEIYRVCKNKAIVQILAPYSNTSLDQANYYHKIVFNEDTLRLCTSYPTSLVDFEEYYCPHSPIWGLADSDNSGVEMQLEPLKIEFFYYKEYRHLTQEQKRHARKALHNVCDQLFYVLVVNKSNQPFSDEELKKLSEQAKTIEPSVINVLRNRDLLYNSERSILTDITQPLMEKQQFLNSKLDDLTTKFNNLQEENNKLKQTIDMQLVKNKEFEQEYNRKLDHVIKLELEILQKNERGYFLFDYFKIFDARRDSFSLLIKGSQNFTDQIILNCIDFHKGSILKFSKVVPCDDYIEYFIKGYGEKINYFLVSNYGSCLFIEVVQDGKIVKQESFTVSHEGLHQIEVGKLNGNVAIRFKSLSSTSIIRVLEVINRKSWIFEKNYLAAFID